jgi:hypothetical protein
VSAVLGASAVNDFAQAGFNWVCARSNAAQSSASAQAETDGKAAQPGRAARFSR